MSEADGIPGQAFASVWDALEDSPVEAANMRMRSELMIAIRQAIAEWGIIQAAAARRLEVTQPRLNDLLRDRINNFSLDALTVLAARAGLNVHTHIEHRTNGSLKHGTSRTVGRADRRGPRSR